MKTNNDEDSVEKRLQKLKELEEEKKREIIKLKEEIEETVHVLEETEEDKPLLEDELLMQRQEKEDEELSALLENAPNTQNQEPQLIDEIKDMYKSPAGSEEYNPSEQFNPQPGDAYDPNHAGVNDSYHEAKTASEKVTEEFDAAKSIMGQANKYNG